MRWLIAFLVMLFVSAEANAVLLNFTPTITLTAVTNTSIRIQLAGLRATGIDTIKVYSAGSDSAAATTTYSGHRFVFKASVTKDTTVTGLAPGTIFTWRCRADSAGTYRQSANASLTLQNVQISDPISPSIKEDFRIMHLANSWPKTPTYNTAFTIADTGRDSTLVYEVWPATGVVIRAYSGATDSTQVKYRFMGGYSTASAGGLFLFAPMDSLTIAAKGTYARTLGFPAGCKHFYVQIVGQTGNAHATVDSLWVRRVRF